MPPSACTYTAAAGVLVCVEIGLTHRAADGLASHDAVVLAAFRQVGDLLSFPTRRSSDLAIGIGTTAFVADDLVNSGVGQAIALQKGLVTGQHPATGRIGRAHV